MSWYMPQAYPRLLAHDTDQRVLHSMANISPNAVSNWLQRVKNEIGQACERGIKSVRYFR